MPWWKPKSWESTFGALQREIHEETSLKLDLKSIPTLFWYYVIQEDWEEYLQLRYFIEIEDIDEENLKPNEKWDIDCIKYVKLVKASKIQFIMPWLYNSWESNSFTQKLLKIK